MRIIYLLIVIFVFTVTLGAVNKVSANMDFIFGAGIAEENIDAELSLSKQSPGPFEEVVVTINTNTFKKIIGVEWFLDSNIVEESSGKMSITLLTKDIGERTNIRAVLQVEDDVTVLEEDVVPKRVILLKEAQTYTPAFYKGGAKQSPRSFVKILAITEIAKETGDLYTPEELFYKWSKNGINLKELSGTGMNAIAVRGPGRFGKDLYVLTILNQDGKVLSTSGIVLESENVDIVLYEKKPLIGESYYKAINNNDNIWQNGAVEIIAEPYFINANERNSNNLKYKWKIGGKEVSLFDKDKQSEIIISPDEMLNDSKLKINVKVVNLNDTLQNAYKSVKIILNEGSVNSLF